MHRFHSFVHRFHSLLHHWSMILQSLMKSVDSLYKERRIGGQGDYLRRLTASVRFRAGTGG